MNKQYLHSFALLAMPIIAVSMMLAGCNTPSNKPLATGEPSTIPELAADPYLQIDAEGNDPLYATYNAAMERSRLYGDKGYQMDYWSGCSPLNYSSQKGGRLYSTWEFDMVVVDHISDYFVKPVVRASFPDLAIIDYEPFEGISVRETFLVYSSSLAVVDMKINNHSGRKHAIDCYPVLELGNDSLIVQNFDHAHNGYVANHRESRQRLISNLYANGGYPEKVRNLFATDGSVFSYGAYEGDLKDFYTTVKTDFYAENRSDSLNCRESGRSDFIALHRRFVLNPGEEKTVRYFRGWQDQKENADSLWTTIEMLKKEDLTSFVRKDISMFAHIPHIKLSKLERIAYLGAFNLARGCMLPPEGLTHYNYYVFSREPLWGWGHGHQVLHESLSMMAYAYLDPLSAEGSQRVYMEQQGTDGLIAYRHGPRGAQTYPHEGMPTTSAPFFSWINLEVFKVGRDTAFLREAYASGVKYANWLLVNRDQDKDGTLEWGPYGIIENVRDWYNAVFQVSAERYLDVDKEDISDELECLDLSLMVVKEMKSLGEMASVLGLAGEAAAWSEKAQQMSNLINERMWDKETKFYYSINKADHSFSFLTRDLRRQEIIGFLPLWAGVATPERADILRNKLINPETFWRKYGVPTLSATDEWYSPNVDYCCKWNGPVWMLWDYMVFEGLVQYGYKKEANALADKMMLAVTTQLSKNHHYWESYSPDYDVLNSPPNYIWDAIIAKLLIERDKIR
jgi:hypothetical protein